MSTSRKIQGIVSNFFSFKNINPECNFSLLPYLSQWMDPCLINLEQVEHPGTVPLLDTMTFAFWQELTLVHKMGLCLDFSTAKLKIYALKSGKQIIVLKQSTIS